MKINNTAIVETNNRYAALEWWNNLPFYSSNTNKSKKHYYDNYKANVYTVAKDCTELTGKEIQNIWAVETNEEQSVHISMDDAAKNHSTKVWGEYGCDLFKNDDIISDKSLAEITQDDFKAGWQERDNQLLLTIEIQKQMIKELCGVLQYWLSDSFSSDREFNRKMANEDLTILEKAKNLINE